MTSPRDPADPTVARSQGRGRRSKRPGPPQPSDQRGLVVVGILSGLAVIVAAAALFITMTRPAPVAEDSCRTVAWNALPASGSLPTGWRIEGSGFYTDGYGASLSGPTPSGTQASAPALTLRVSCYGADGHLAVKRSHDSDIAVGGTDYAFADIGDETLATRDSTGTTTSVYIRRGPLVASIAAQGASPDDLEQAASAVDDGMVAAQAKAAVSPPVEPTSTDEAAIPTDANTTDVPEPTPTDSHTFPDLEALLPKTADGTALTSRSTTGPEALQSDPAPDELIKWLADNGKKTSDLEVAEAFDPTTSIDLDLTAFRLKGITPVALRQELLKTWLGATASGITTTQKTIGGKPVLAIDYGDGSAPDYVFIQGDAVVIMTSSDTDLAGRVLAGLK